MTKTRRPIRPGGVKNSQYNPIRRLIAAYTVQAAIDYFYPTPSLAREHRQSAAEFILSEDGQYIIEYFGITLRKIREAINGNGK
jgi:hypothetical protein